MPTIDFTGRWSYTREFCHSSLHPVGLILGVVPIALILQCPVDELVELLKVGRELRVPDGGISIREREWSAYFEDLIYMGDKVNELLLPSLER